MEFNKSYSYKKIGIIAIEEPIFSFFKKKLFTDNTFNTPVKKEKNLSTALLTLSTTHLIKDDSDTLSTHFSNNNFSTPQKLTRIRNQPTKYSLVA